MTFSVLHPPHRPHTPVFTVPTGSNLEWASEGSLTPSFVLKKDEAVMPRGPRADFTTHHGALSGPDHANLSQPPHARGDDCTSFQTRTVLPPLWGRIAAETGPGRQKGMWIRRSPGQMPQLIPASPGALSELLSLLSPGAADCTWKIITPRMPASRSYHTGIWCAGRVLPWAHWGAVSTVFLQPFEGWPCKKTLCMRNNAQAFGTKIIWKDLLMHKKGGWVHSTPHCETPQWTPEKLSWGF